MPRNASRNGQASKGTLGAAADELNEALQRAEKLVCSMGYGISLGVYIEDTPNEDGEQHTLWFGKRSGTWQLYLTRGKPNAKASEEMALYSASIETRSLAAQAIPRLIHALEGHHVGQANEIREAASKLNGFLETIENSDSVRRDVFHYLHRQDDKTQAGK